MQKNLAGLLFLVLTAAASAGSTPPFSNYQGVLRDNNGAPLDGDFDMVFRFFDTDIGGNEVLVDEHLAAGTGAVTVTGGLFNVWLGSGNVTDGSGPGVFVDLPDVFAQVEEVWLELQVGGETLSPRVVVLSAAYALNARTLRGRDDSEFLDLSATSQEKTGLLTLSGGVDLGPGLDDDLDATDVSTLTGGANADALHTHTLVGESDLLDGIDSTQFLRSDANDTFESGTLSIGAGTTLAIDGQLDVNTQQVNLNADGPNADVYLNFYAADSTNGEQIRWELLQDRFEISDELAVEGPLRVGPAISDPVGYNVLGTGTTSSGRITDIDDLFVTDDARIGGDLEVDGRNLDLNVAGPDGDVWLNFYDGGSPTGEQLRWELLQHRFEVSDELAIEGPLRVGSTITDPVAYSHIGAGGTPSSTQINDDADLYVEGALEIDSSLLLDGTLYMDDDGPDFQQSIFFYENGSPIGESLFWDDINDRFQFSDALGVDADLYMGTADGNQIIHFHEGGLPAGVNIGWYDTLDRFGLSSDVGIRGDLYMRHIGPADGDQFIYFWNNNMPTGQSFGWDDGQGRFELSSGLATTGTIAVGTNLLLGSQPAYNRFGLSGSSDSGNMTSNNDVYVSDDVELDGSLYLNSNVYMDDNGPDGEQNIRWYNGGSNNGERLQWDDAADRFEVSDDFHAFGELTATTKNFVQNHPYRDDLEVVYTSLEGDEATTFTRGFARLEGDVARVRLGETFALVTNPDLGLTAHVTPRGVWADLYVESVTTEELVVRSRNGDSPDAVFDYIVYGLRVGFEEFPVLRKKLAEAYVPPQGYYDSHYRESPELRAQTALARYRQMTGGVRGIDDVDLSGARALCEAIGEHEPGYDYPVGSTVAVAHMGIDSPGDGSIVEPVVTRGDEAVSEAAAAAPYGADSAAASSIASSSKLYQDAEGNVYANSFRPTAGELARLAPVGEAVEAGDVLVIDAERPGQMRLARAAADTAVFGIVAAEPGVVLGAEPPEEVALAEGDPVSLELDDAIGDGPATSAGTQVPVAVSGVVLCKVDAGYGSIRPGDLLTTSHTAGHAMRADEPRLGTILGKALEPLDAGTGVIRVLVMLR